MSVLNQMLRDLEARGLDPFKDNDAASSSGSRLPIEPRSDAGVRTEPTITGPRAEANGTLDPHDLSRGRNRTTLPPASDDDPARRGQDGSTRGVGRTGVAIGRGGHQGVGGSALPRMPSVIVDDAMPAQHEPQAAIGVTALRETPGRKGAPGPRADTASRDDDPSGIGSRPVGRDRATELARLSAGESVPIPQPVLPASKRPSHWPRRGVVWTATGALLLLVGGCLAFLEQRAQQSAQVRKPLGWQQFRAALPPEGRDGASSAIATVASANSSTAPAASAPLASPAAPEASAALAAAATPALSTTSGTPAQSPGSDSSITREPQFNGAAARVMAGDPAGRQPATSAQPAAVTTTAQTTIEANVNGNVNGNANVSRYANGNPKANGNTTNANTSAAAAGAGASAPARTTGAFIEPSTSAAASLPRESPRELAREAPREAPRGASSQPRRSAAPRPETPAAPSSVSAAAAPLTASSDLVTAASAPSRTMPRNRIATTAGVTAATPDPAADLSRAFDLLGRGRNTEAIALLRKVVAQQPDHAQARNTLAALLSEAQRNDEALLVLLEGASQAPGRFAVPAAQMQAALGDATGALVTLQRLPLAQLDAAVLAMQAGLLQRLGRHSDAILAFEQALATPSANALWRVGLAMSLEAEGRRVDALSALRRAAHAPLPADVRTWVNERINALGIGAAEAKSLPGTATLADPRVGLPTQP